MVFSSLIFLFGFLPVFLFLYYICPDRWKNLCLFVGSLIFYFYGVKDQPLYFFSSDFVHLGQLPDWHSPWTAQKKRKSKKMAGSRYCVQSVLAVFV